jgi:three-Cys-motif partner protein
MGCNSNFFDKKKEWSKLKDKLLANFLTPYLAKIKIFSKEIAIFDCFAGKGKFDDGFDGSPLIILKKIEENKANSARAYLIEEKYGDDLEKNTIEFINKCTIIKTSFQSNIEQIGKLCFNKNVFLYVDPYGIKSLDFRYFNHFKSSGYATLEMLLNFNTTPTGKPSSAFNFEKQKIFLTKL